MWQVPHLGNIVPEVGTLEDPDESRLAHMRARKRKLYHSDAKGECLFWKHVFELTFLEYIIAYYYL